MLMNTVNCNSFPQLLERKTSLNRLEKSSYITADALAEHHVVSPPQHNYSVISGNYYKNGGKGEMGQVLCDENAAVLRNSLVLRQELTP